ncbi:MAG: rhodanese-like domain-containing protein [Bradyrhizobiaceae bacterium]|nr:rhodanese-like domain-containing protein [Bradyrhizobiaceae bacterium]
MFTQITAAQVKQRLEAGEKLTILDVRRQEEWDEFHIDNAIHIPLHDLEDRWEELSEHKDHEIVVYCRSGNRSSQACMFLQIVGFTNPVNMRGGILTW